MAFRRLKMRQLFLTRCVTIYRKKTRRHIPEKQGAYSGKVSEGTGE